MSLFKKEVVSCNECKCLLYENDAQKIETLFTNEFTLLGKTKSYKYYCNTHRINYDRIVSTYFVGDFYYKEMQVDEKGEPIGYKKIKQNENNKNN